MAQVSMTGNEYAEMLRKIEQGAEIIRHLKMERRITLKEDNIRTYSAGEFPNSPTFPDWLQEMLAQDMVQQLLKLPSEQFALWAMSEHIYYNVKGRELASWTGSDRVNLLELSPELNERRELIRAEVKAEIDEEVPTDGE